VVLDIKPSDRRVRWESSRHSRIPGAGAEKYPVGTVVTGKVRNIAEFGAFVEIEMALTGWCTSET